jgi:hypothetical protein
MYRQIKTPQPTDGRNVALNTFSQEDSCHLELVGSTLENVGLDAVKNGRASAFLGFRSAPHLPCEAIKKTRLFHWFD